MVNEQFIEKDDHGLFMFYCPGCKCSHGVTNIWKIDIPNNTISPSVLVRSGNEKGPTVCHSFVRNGTIQYLNDCTHNLAGKTVDMELI